MFENKQSKQVEKINGLMNDKKVAYSSEIEYSRFFVKTLVFDPHDPFQNTKGQINQVLRDVSALDDIDKIYYSINYGVYEIEGTMFSLMYSFKPPRYGDVELFARCLKNSLLINGKEWNDRIPFEPINFARFNTCIKYKGFEQYLSNPLRSQIINLHPHKTFEDKLTFYAITEIIRQIPQKEICINAITEPDGHGTFVILAK